MGDETSLAPGEDDRFPKPPPTDRAEITRKFLTRAIVSGFAIAVVGLLIWSQRVPIADTLANAALRYVFGQDASITVQRIELDGLVFEDLTLPNGPRATRIQVVPNPKSIFSLPLQGLEVDGLRATFRVSQDGGATVDGLSSIFSETQPSPQESAPAFELPIRSLILRNLEIEAYSTLGLQTLVGDVDLQMGAAPKIFPIRADIALSSQETESAVALTATAESGVGKIDGLIDLSLPHWLPYLYNISSAEGRLSVSLDLVTSTLETDGLNTDLMGSALAALTGKVELDWSDARLETAFLPPFNLKESGVRADIGGGQITLNVTRPIDVQTETLPPSLTDLLPSELRPYLGERSQVSFFAPPQAGPLARLVPAPEGKWRFLLNGAVQVSSGLVALSVSPRDMLFDSAFKPLSMSVTEAQLSVLRGENLLRDVSGSLSLGPVDIALADFLALKSIPALTVPFQLDASIYGKIADPIWTRQTRAKLSGSASISREGREIGIVLSAPGTLTAQGVTGTGDLRLSPNVTAQISRRNPVRIGFSTNDPLKTARVSGTLLLDPFSLALPQAAPGYRFSLSRLPITFRASAGEVRATFGRATLQELSQGVVVTGIEANTVISAAKSTLAVTAQSIALEQTPILPGGQRLDISLVTEPDGDQRLTGDISLADQKLALSVAAILPIDPSTPKELTLQTNTVKLGPGGLFLADLLPPSMLETFPANLSVLGNFTLRSDVKLSPSGPEGIAVLTVGEGVVRTPKGSAQNIETKIAVDLASPPRTPTPFDISADLVAPVIGRVPFRARLRVEEDLETEITEAQLSLFDGDIALVDSRFDPYAQVLSGTLRLRRVDLEPALALAAVEGLSAKGRLSGLIPLAIGPEGISVTEGTLASDGGGILKIDNATVNQALSSEQEAVQLLSNVLKDFHYDTLGAVVTLPSAGSGTIRLSLDGRNPAVLEGHPFDLNVNFESDFRKLFNILVEAVGFSSDILRSANPSLRRAVRPN